VEYLWAWLKRHALANFCPLAHRIEDHCAQQAAKRPTPPIDHHGLLEAG
jgi:hypothetical protein